MEELDACCGLFHLLQTAVTNEGMFGYQYFVICKTSTLCQPFWYVIVEESQKRLLNQKPFIDIVMKFLNPQSLKKKGKVKEACLNLMLTISESAIGRKYIATQFDVLE